MSEPDRDRTDQGADEKTYVLPRRGASEGAPMDDAAGSPPVDGVLSGPVPGGGDGETIDIPLRPGNDLVVGRDPRCDVTIDVNQVSRRHARLFKESGSWRLQDLDSANGTFVNGDRVREATLTDGDRVKLGAVRLTVALPGAMKRRPPSKAAPARPESRPPSPPPEGAAPPPPPLPLAPSPAPEPAGSAGSDDPEATRPAFRTNIPPDVFYRKRLSSADEEPPARFGFSRLFPRPQSGPVLTRIPWPSRFPPAAAVGAVVAVVAVVVVVAGILVSGDTGTPLQPDGALVDALPPRLDAGPPQDNRDVLERERQVIEREIERWRAADEAARRAFERKALLEGDQSAQEFMLQQLRLAEREEAARKAAQNAMTARQIMDEVSARHDRPTEFETLTMTLVDAEGRTEIRELRRFVRFDSAARRRSLVVFDAPAGLRGVAVLSVDAADDAAPRQWLYLPAQSDRSFAIEGRKRATPFLGTDDTFEDLVPFSPDRFSYDRLPDQVSGGQRYFVIKATPAAPDFRADSGYAYRVLWVRKDSFVVVRIDHYDREEQLIKRRTATDFETVGGLAWRAGKGVVENFPAGHRTLVTVIDRGFSDTDCPAELFEADTFADAVRR